MSGVAREGNLSLFLRKINAKIKDNNQLTCRQGADQAQQRDENHRQARHDCDGCGWRGERGKGRDEVVVVSLARRKWQHGNEVKLRAVGSWPGAEKYEQVLPVGRSRSTSPDLI